MECTLSHLPTELIGTILETVSTPGDLFGIISASPDCYRVFVATPERYLFTALRSVVPTPIWAEFCATLCAASKFQIVVDEELLAADKASIILFLDRYFAASPDFASPCSKSELLAACKLHYEVSFFLKDITLKTSQEALFLSQVGILGSPSNPGSERVTASEGVEISDAEELRIYRALLRFELYCRVFRPAQRSDQVTEYSGDEQFDLFLERFEPWEVEEITCVHQHLAGIIEITLSAMNREFEAEVRRLVADSDALSPKEGTQEDAPQPESATVSKLEDISSFLDGALHNFSKEFKRHSIGAISSIISVGLSCMHDLARSSNTERFELLRRNHTEQSPFMAHALPTLSLLGALPTNPEEVQREDPAQANLGYVLYKANEHGGYLGIRRSPSNFPYRALGYVFWDSARILSAPFREAFSQVKTAELSFLSERYEGLGRKCPEENLSGVKLSRAQVKILIEKFGLSD
ncbi:hypothetical protein NLG97_g2661 [Lecanicillium saksenae]|uniref:Uncharacterized protein n=1 Tax=Lecanicillium saksenae TaxID=468837 RepID=A0ACC1R1K0_9HYPO|nr:hypothetical protein NLG97_g2661 [Lecanicillium saksenae]